MSVFSSEFWRSLYFVGMGGQASTETEPGQMAAILFGSASVIATISGGEREAETKTPRKGGKDDRRRPIVPQYVEWTKERELAIARHEKALFAELLDEEVPPPLPVAEKRGLNAEKELERINLLILQAMQAAADDARRKDRERLRKEAKRSKVAPPTTQEDTKALVYWLVKRAEALREAEEDEDETILLLAA